MDEVSISATMERSSGRNRGGEGSTLRKTCAILRALGEGSDLSLDEIAARTELNKASAFRILKDLVAADFVTKTTDRRYSLGIAMMFLSTVLLKKLEIFDNLVGGSLRRLAKESGEVAHFTMSRDSELLYANQARDFRATIAHVPIGSRVPLGVTPPGVAILAAMPPEQAGALLNAVDKSLGRYPPQTRKEIEASIIAARSSGYACCQDWRNADQEGIAVLVVSDDFGVVGCVSIALPKYAAAAREQELVAAVKREAEIIAKRISASRHMRVRKHLYSEMMSRDARH